MNENLNPLNQKILKEGSELPGSSINDQLRAKGIELKVITGGKGRELTETERGAHNAHLIETLPEGARKALGMPSPERPRQGKNKDRNHPGNGKKAGKALSNAVKNVRETKAGDPATAEAAVREAKRDSTRLDHDIERLKKDKAEILFDLADLRIKEKQAEEQNYSKFTKKHIAESITAIQKRLNVLNGLLPEPNVFEDHTKIQKIITEWSTGKRNWRKELTQFKKAEGRLTKHPDDRRAQGEANRARAEMHATEEKIEQVAHEAETIVGATATDPAHNEGISYTAEQARKDAEEWGKRFMARQTSPETPSETTMSPEPQPAILNESTTEINLEEKIMKPELPPIEYTMPDSTPETSAHDERVNARLAEVDLREEALAGDTSTAATEEKAELAKEKASLEKEKESGEATKPLQTAYDLAMERIWKENEEKREAIKKAEQGKTSETATPEPENMEGVVVGETMESAEEKFARAQARLMEMDVDEDARVEKAGGWVAEQARNVGNWWNKQPRHYKILLSTGLVLSGAGSVALGSVAMGTAVATFGATTRALQGMALFAGMEELMKRQHERKTGEPITPEAAARQTLLAAALAATVAGLLPTAVHNVLEGAGVGVAEVAKTEIEKPQHAEAPGISTETASTEPEETTEVRGMEERVYEKVSNLSEDEFRAMGTEYANAIVDGNPDKMLEIEQKFGLTHNEFLKMLGEAGAQFGDDATGNFIRESILSAGTPIEAPSSASELQWEHTASGETTSTSGEPSIETQNLGDMHPSAQTEDISEMSSGEIAEMLREEQAQAQTSGYSEINPIDQQILAQASDRLEEHMKAIFPEEKGFLGFGGTSAGTIPHELMNKTTNEIISTDYAEGSKGAQLKDYLNFAIKETGVSPFPNEDFKAFAQRAIATEFTKRSFAENAV